MTNYTGQNPFVHCRPLFIKETHYKTAILPFVIRHAGLMREIENIVFTISEQK